MNPSYEWIALAVSIIAFFSSLFDRFKATKKERVNLGTFSPPKKEKHEIKKLLLKYNRNLPNKTLNFSFISSYNLRSILSSLPFFKKLPLSSSNYFVKAYIYDSEKSISSHNYLVKARIPIKTTIKGKE